MAQKISFDAATVAMASGGFSYGYKNIKTLTSGNNSGWFSALAPLPAMAPEDVAGREFDYAPGYNLNYRPRAGENVTFEQMRQLADSYDLLRLLIETRKDQLANKRWKIQNKDPDAQKNDDPRIKELTAFFEMPDRENDWDTWYRMLLEDLLVIDAPTVYIHRTLGGKVYSLDPIDGSTIKRVLTDAGRTPDGELPAYQQILKGVPAVNYTRDELIYAPRNRRTNRVYGYSPVEQSIMTVNIALRRQMNQLEYYTQGNTPNLLLRVPQDWQPEQIKQFQKYWDSLTNTSKHRARFIPAGVDPIDTKEKAIKDEADEWLARIMCFAFSIAPTPFIKQMNRSTSETAQDASLKEGEAPLMQWTSSFVNRIIRVGFGWSDLEFVWEDEESVDPLENAKIKDIKLRNGSMTINESRADDGLDPIDGGDTPIIYTAGGAITLKDVLEPPATPPAGEVAAGKPNSMSEEPPGPAKEAPTEKIAKMSPPPDDGSLPPEQDPNSKIQNYLAKKIKSIFKSTAQDIAGQVTDQLSADKAVSSGTPIPPDAAGLIAAEVVAKIDFSAWDVLVDPTAEELEAAVKAAGVEAISEVGIEDGTVGLNGEALDLTNVPFPEAETYAKARGAELVGKKWVDGELVDNPNAKWAITQSTRDMIKAQVETAITDGLTMDELAKQLVESHAFSASRAMMIARTEVAKATSQGAMDGYRLAKSEYGVNVKKRWVTAGDEDVDSAQCKPNEEAGVLDLDAAFPSGDDAPPAHPNCRCAIAPVIDNNQE